MINLVNLPSLHDALDEVVDFCRNEGGEINIIVPDKLSLFMERYIFEKLQIEASFDIKVSTLNRFAKRTLNISQDSEITKVGSIILIHKILNENINNLKVLKSKAYSFSYAEEIYNTIQQLKASKITPQEMEDFKSNNAQLMDKILDLSLIYTQYEEHKAGLLDQSDTFLMSTLTVAKNRHNEKIIFVGFDDYTAIEYSIIERLAIENNVYILNYMTDKKNRYIYNTEIESQLRNIAYINELPFDKVSKVGYSNGIREFLTDNIFSTTNEKFTLKKDEVRVFASNSIRAEIEFVARDIRSKILHGENYSNFGIATYDLEGKNNIFNEIFSKYEINYYLDSDFSLNKSVFYKFLVSIFKFNLEGYELTHLIDMINSPFFDIEQEKKYKICDILIKREFRSLKLDFVDFGDDLIAEKDKLKEFINLFIIDATFNVNDIFDMLENANKILDFDGKLLSLANNNSSLQDRLLLLKSREMVNNLLLEVDKFYPQIDMTSLYDILVRVASIVKINNLPQTLDAVKIVDAKDCMEVFNNLYILNCTNESAPSLKNDCGIILDSEIEELNFSHKLAPTIAHINRLSKLRLFNTCLQFNNSLTISYSKTASELVTEICNRVIVRTKDKGINLCPVEVGNLGKNLALSRWDYIEKICKQNSKNNNFVLNFNEKYSKNHEISIKNKNFSQISNDNLKIYENLNTISASQLENYFKCPFYYFSANVLKIKEREESEIQSFDVGNILHELLYKYYKRNKVVGDIYEFCRDEVFAFIDKNPRLKLKSSSPIITNLIDESVRVIYGLNYIDENSAFQPVNILLEHKFGGGTALKLKNIDVIGTVDRVDEYNDMLRIIDYKSGRANASLKELYYGNKLQLFLYSCAMENELKKSVVGGFYLPLHNAYTKLDDGGYSLNGFFINNEEIVKALDGRIQPDEKSDIVNIRLTKKGLARRTRGYKELSSNEMLSLKEYAKAVSENAVDEIKSGFISPSPSTVSDPCQYCPYMHVCLKSSSKIGRRIAKNVKPESFGGENA